MDLDHPQLAGDGMELKPPSTHAEEADDTELISEPGKSPHGTLQYIIIIISITISILQHRLNFPLLLLFICS